MSIVTYENVDTPVFEIDFLRYLFANGEEGSVWGPLPYYSDAAGTVEADWGDPVGNIPDASGNEQDWTQVTSTARPILRGSPSRLEFDGTDDQVTTTLPAISGGTIVLAGTNGIWIGEIDFAGGEFSVGPGTYTGSPEGILEVIGDPLVGGSFVIDRQLSSSERARVITRMKQLGAPGVFELGPEMVVNGDFSDGLDGYSPRTLDTDLSIVDGRLRVTNTAAVNAPVGVTQFLVVGSGTYMMRVDVDVGTTGGIYYGRTGDGILARTSGGYSAVFHGAGSDVAVTSNAQRSPAGAYYDVSYVSFRKLELVP